MGLPLDPLPSDRLLVPLHIPVVVTDGGPWACHDYACPVCGLRKAVYMIDGERFQPCWECQDAGWRLVRRRSWVDRLRRRFR